ncbi:ABC transporter permease [Sporolactobacillus sp. STSJ-5]|uniref:ABC transporter permease n=1 Tax=Sporolactobacillus sp. STSJ-5 TaxID=2965076 RepID=UPI0021064131|nr:ABC transporter permease [Sporolactobacillus sp. STSJ-5]MCQ2009963.1 ABC transporter permease [Sporolactobacillus sp. STSJ-5]
MIKIWDRFRHNPAAVGGLLFILLLIASALLAKQVAPQSPYAMSTTARLTGPSAVHWFGTDQFGRDIFSRIIYGSRISLQVGIIAVGFSFVLGTLMGVIAGYAGGWIDQIISRITDILFALPDILLALVIMAILGPSLNNLMLAIGIVYTPIFSRIARGAVLNIRDSLFIEAAYSMGVKQYKILLRHLLPNILSPLIVQITLSFAFAILAEASLSFLGLGVSPDTPSWGIMLSSAKDWMELSWWTAVFPGLAITLAVLSFNVVGDGLRDALDPRINNGQ